MKPSERLTHIAERVAAHERVYGEQVSLRNPGTGFKLGEHIYSNLDRYMLMDVYCSAKGYGYVNDLNARLDIHSTSDIAYLGGIYHEALRGSNFGVIDGITFNSARTIDQFRGSMQALSWLAQHYPEDVPHRIVMPIEIERGDLGHTAAVAIEWDGERFTHVNLFEQHARDDGDIRDFSIELEQAGAIIQEALGAEHRAMNTEPFCREQKVCFVVGLETAKKLLELENKGHSSDYMQDITPLVMDRVAVEDAHEANVRLFSRIQSRETLQDDSRASHRA
ncbi:MAG: hypothetical protein ACOYJ2_03410 [Rickettsiales bacterium]